MTEATTTTTGKVWCVTGVGRGLGTDIARKALVAGQITDAITYMVTRPHRASVAETPNRHTSQA